MTDPKAPQRPQFSKGPANNQASKFFQNSHLTEYERIQAAELGRTEHVNNKISSWRQIFPMGSENPLEMYKEIFRQKRLSNGLFGLAIFAFVGTTFWFTISRMGQDDFAESVDERGFKKTKH